MRNIAAIGVVFSLALSSFATPAHADTVEISGGGHLDGRVKRTPDFVVVEVDDEIQVALPASRVRSVVMSDDLAEYRRNAAKAGDDAELHYQLAIWCVTANNVPGRADYYKRFHMRRAIELDPEHAKARGSLGYKKVGNRWVTRTDLMHDRGMISVGGKQVLPEAYSIDEANDAAEVASKLWIKDVNRLVGIAQKNSSKSAEAYASLEAIDDPLAAAAIAGQLKDSRGKQTQSQAMRKLWVQLLSKFQNGTSVRALVLAGVDEPDPTIREMALTSLQAYGSSSAVSTYTPMLRSNEHRIVNLAAEALSYFPDPEQAMDYVNALVTTKKTLTPAGAGVNVGFGDNGGGLTTGSKPTQLNDTRNNPAVLGLLRTIEPEVDFGYDEEKWRDYFASKKTAYSGDLRRDP